jgi:hypothetical protein
MSLKINEQGNKVDVTYREILPVKYYYIHSFDDIILAVNESGATIYKLTIKKEIENE